MREISKDRAEELNAAWEAASDTQRLSLNRMSWLCVSPDTTYYESEPSQLEKKAAARIAELEAKDERCGEFEAKLMAAASSIVDHWREFGPEHGLDEKIEAAAKLLGK